MKMNNCLLQLIILIAYGLFVNCANNTETKTYNRVVPVKTQKVQSGGISVVKEYVGKVEEESEASLSFQVQGNIEQIYVNAGESVRKGQELARLNKENLQNAYQAALASQKQAKDALDRLQYLYDNQSLPEIKYVEVKTKLEQANAAAAVSEKNLKESVLRAPFAGVIGVRRAEVGENVMPGETVMTLLDVSKVKVKISVPENEISKLQKGDSAIIVVSATQKEYPATVYEKSIVGDQFSHTYEVRLRPQSKDGLLPGMVCSVKIWDQAEGTSLVVPNKAVQVSADDKRFVWKVQDGKVTAVQVRIGALTDDGIVIEEGLNDGDEIVVDGYQKVSEGMKVCVL